MLDDKLLWNIIICISTTIKWIFFKICIEEFSELKKSKLTINILIAISIVLTIILNVMLINHNIKLLITIIVSLIFYIYNYKVKIFRALVLVLVCWMGIVGLEFISFNITFLLNPKIVISDLLKNNVFRFELILINDVLLLLILPFIKNFKTEKDLDIKNCIYLIVPLVSNLLSITLIFILLLESKNNICSQKGRLLIVSIMLFLSNIAWIKITMNISKSNKIKLENELIREKIYIQYKRYLDMQENQFKIRKLYHDINNHIFCIEKLQKNNNNCASEYINIIKNELKYIEDEISTNNMILDIIVNDKKKFCGENNIKFYVDINFSKCEFIDIIDICTIFSNIIDNAIEACLKVDDNKNRFIKLKGKFVNRIFVIKCENSKVNEIKLKKRGIMTDKKDSFLHGIGIKSIKSCVQKYDGEVSIDFTKDIFIMRIYIPLI